MFPKIDESQLGYTLQSSVFGHRLKPDQTIYEYMIEFLQVMISNKTIIDSNNKIIDEFIEYFPVNENVKKNKLQFHPISRVGLKRFIFFKKSKQDGKFPVDIGAYNRCKEILKDSMEISSDYEFIDEDYTIETLEQLLYGFRSVVKNRSWFAQSALPVCPELILPETMGDKRKRKNDVKQYDDGCEMVDGLFETNRYNFMARGGEVYYLHLLKALNSNSDYANDIDKGFKSLISKFPQISLLSNFINDTWVKESGCHSKEKITKTLGTIPDGFERREKYTLIELNNFLSANIHPFEKIDILSFGIVLQIIRMMHEQACYITNKNNPFWMIDVRENNKSNTEIRKLAIKNYAQFEQDILDALHANLGDDNEEESNIMESAIKDTYKLYRKLGKEIGIIIPITGPGMRFTLSETMVKFLVLSIIKPKGKLTLDTFLYKLYEHYGMVIDSVHYDLEVSKNKDIYIDDSSMLYKNKMAFQQMLKDCGFLRDLSDSTSIVENPYDRGDMFE